MNVIDAKNCIAGRLASWIASELLKGKKISVVNAEKAVVSGKPDSVLEHFREKIVRGDPYRGPFYPRYPDKILKRMIRGMLPYKKPRGRKALKNLKVYISIPEKLQGTQTTIIKETENRLSCKFTTLDEVGKKFGAKTQKMKTEE